MKRRSVLRCAHVLAIWTAAAPVGVVAHAQRAAVTPATALSTATLDSGPRRPARDTAECIVTRIVDGDTIDCRGLGRVRLIGIDAPEATQRPFAAAATSALTAILRTGSRAQIEQDVEARDRYGRTLGYVWLDGKQVNWMMIRAGWTVLLTYPPNVRYVEFYTRAQQRAREEKLGLWKVSGFACTPVDRRRKRC